MVTFTKVVNGNVFKEKQKSNQSMFISQPTVYLKYETQDRYSKPNRKYKFDDV